MKLRKSFELTEKFVDKIIPAAYGDASLLDKIKVTLACKQNPKVRELYLSHRQTARKIKQLQGEVCPEDLVKTVKLKTVHSEKNKGGFLFDFYSIIFLRPVVSAVTTLILITAIVTTLVINRPSQYNYSHEEILQAEKQAAYAFTIVDKIFKETHSTLQKEILGDKVAKPINKSIGIINNLFKGEKNETN